MAIGLLLLLADVRQERIIAKYFNAFFDPSRPTQEYALKCNTEIHTIHRKFVESQRELPERDDPDSVRYRMATTILNKGGLCAHRALLLGIALRSHGIPARKLLIGLVDGIASHVVVEAWLDGKWRVLDPLFGYAYPRADGELATAQDLKENPELVSQVVRADHSPFPASYPEQVYNYRQVTRFNWHKFAILPVLRGWLGTGADEWEPPFVLNSPLTVLGSACIGLAAALVLTRARRSSAAQRSRGVAADLASDGAE